MKNRIITVLLLLLFVLIFSACGETNGFGFAGVGTTAAQTKASANAAAQTKASTNAAAHVHSFGEWKTAKAATCTGAGTEERSCSVCGAKETRAIAALGHEEVNGVCKRCRIIMLPVKLQLPSLPCECSYYSGMGGLTNMVLSTCQVETVTLSETANVYGDITRKLVFTGKKTYDKSGADYQRMCEVKYKIIDADGVCVVSSYFLTNDLAVGEKFKVERSINGLEPGKTYTLVLYDGH